MSETQFIRAGSFIDGSGAAMRRNVLLAVKGNIITAIGSATDLPRYSGVAIDDFSHCTIVPALVDCSVSLSRSPAVGRGLDVSSDKFEIGLTGKTSILERHSRYFHLHGVLGAAESGDISGLSEHDLQAIASGGIVDFRIAGSICRNKQFCPAEKVAGSDFIKVYYSGNIENRGIPNPGLSYQDLCRILQNKGGKKAVVVANSRQQVAEALEAGCDAIEQGYAMGEANLRKMADKNVLWIPSVLRAKNTLDAAGGGGEVGCRFSTRYVVPGNPAPGEESFWKKILAEQLNQLRLARKMGVTTAVGTGAGSEGILHGESMVEEMKLFMKVGYSLEETIQCASETGAAFFGMEKLGMLAVRRRATFLIARGTVQQLPRKLSYLEGIYVDGAPSSIYQKNPVMTG